MKKRNVEGRDRWIAHFKGDIPREIHPEDFACAMLAKLLAAPYPDKLADSMMLDSLSRGVPWTEDQLREIARRQIEDPQFSAFLLALSRGLENGRKPPFNAIELAILAGWREVKIIDEPFPGLRNWKPKAATCLLQAMGILSGAADHKHNVCRHKEGTRTKTASRHSL